MAIAFEPGCEPLLPWAPLLNGRDLEAAIHAIAKLAAQPGSPPYPIDVMLSNLAGLAVLRYDKEEIAGLLTGLRERLMLPIDIFEDTWLYKEGQAEGKAEGLLAGKRDAIRLAAHSRFPSLGELIELEAIDDGSTLNDLLLLVLRAQSGNEITAAIQAACSRA